MFAQTFANHTPITPFIILSSVESTNNYAMAKLHAGMVKEGTCFLALSQTKGRGQRGKHWFSNPGENITMSTVFAPAASVSANVSTFPFLLSASMALGCYDFIKDCGFSDLTIKWPNDLYLGDRKAAGILIENIYKGSVWEWSVVGTGVNINQENFQIEGSKAVSLRMITGNEYNIKNMGRELHKYLLKRLEMLSTANVEKIMEEYNSRLYRRGQETRIKKGNIIFTARIERVSEDGELITSGGGDQRYKVGEIEFI